MYEHITFESLLGDMLTRVRQTEPDIDTREGSVIYCALAPAAAELQNMYIQLDYILRESFADTQSRPFLTRRAAEHGIAAKEAVKSRRLAIFNVDVPLGSRFGLNGLYYTVLSRRSAGQFVLECETPGACGNTDSGTLVPCEYLPGLFTAQLTEILSHGADAESEEQLRRRYFQSINSAAFGGNITDYIQKTGAIPGVGGVKVTPAWNGGGTVLLTITGSDSECPAPALVSEVQEIIDPRAGSGLGIAPIGHYVTVRGAEETIINITASLTFSAGYDRESAASAAIPAVEEYLNGLRESWADEESTVVRISAVEQRLLSVPGVLDVTGTALNGVQKNLTLPSGNIPKMGSVTCLE